MPIARCAVAEGIVSAMEERGVRLLGAEGLREGHWALLDFGDTKSSMFSSIRCGSSTTSRECGLMRRGCRCKFQRSCVWMPSRRIVTTTNSQRAL